VKNRFQSLPFKCDLQRYTVGILGAVPTFALFSSVYTLGGEQFPAPAALAWKAVAEVLTSSANGGALHVESS
jgi:hypothetical protein